MTAPSKRSLWIGAALLALLAVVLYRRLGLGDLLSRRGVARAAR